MGEIAPDLLLHIIIFLLFPFVGGYVAYKLKLPAIVGYIVGGIILGSFFSNGQSQQYLAQFSSIGIIFLLFTVGLEVNLERMARFSKFTIYGGFAQVIFSSIFIFILTFIFGFGFIPSILFGVCLALSSTAIVSKIIQEKGQESSLAGNISLGMLVFQDLCAIPLLILVSALGKGGGLVEFIKILFVSGAQASFILASIFFVGRQAVPYIFARTARISRETLNIFTILFIFVVVYIFSRLGLSGPIAAFIAGVLVGQTLQHYHIFSQIRPLRDLFTVLFFVYLGTTVNIGAILSQLPLIIIFVILLTGIKFLVVFLIFTRFKFHTRTAFSLGMLLAQVGEFAFILISQAGQNGLISESQYHFAVTSVLGTIMLAPLLIQNRNKLYVATKALIKKLVPDLDSYLSTHYHLEIANIDVLELKDHVVLCGYGSVGKYIGRALSMAKIPFIAVDYNYYTVETARRSDVNIVYGDPTDIDILDYVQVDTASCLISAVPHKPAQEMIILNAVKLNPKIVIFSRVNNEDEQQRMKDLGAQVVIQPEFEASLAIIRKIFVSYNVSREDIAGKIKRLKIEHGME